MIRRWRIFHTLIVKFSGKIGHGIYDPFTPTRKLVRRYLMLSVLYLRYNVKKAVLVRIPVPLHEALLLWSADLTIERRRAISVPALIAEIVAGEAKRKGRIVDAPQSN